MKPTKDELERARIKAQADLPTAAEIGAFRRGKEARKRGATHDSNPYDDDSLAVMWSGGWHCQDPWSGNC